MAKTLDMRRAKGIDHIYLMRRARKLNKCRYISKDKKANNKVITSRVTDITKARELTKGDK